MCTKINYKSPLLKFKTGVEDLEVLIIQKNNCRGSNKFIFHTKYSVYDIKLSNCIYLAEDINYININTKIKINNAYSKLSLIPFHFNTKHLCENNEYVCDIIINNCFIL